MTTSDKTYPALSVRQPHAALIAAGMKQYETRSWATRYRGLLYLHASKRFENEEQYIARLLCSFYEGVREAIYPNGAKSPVLGCIIARCELVDCIPVEHLWDDLSETERKFGDYSAGRFAWKMVVHKLPDAPIQATGALGIFQWKP